MRILSFNINSGKGKEKTYDADAFTENIHVLADYLRQLLVDKDDIMLLQEIPYQVRGGSDLAKLQAALGDFQLFLPQKIAAAQTCTAAVCRKDSAWKLADPTWLQLSYDKEKKAYNYGNKMIAMQLGELCLLGVHMSDEDSWDNLFATLEVHRFHVLAGDFNVDGLPDKISAFTEACQKLITDHHYQDLLHPLMVTYLKPHARPTRIDRIFYAPDSELLEDIHTDVLQPPLASDHMCLLLTASYRHEEITFRPLRRKRQTLSTEETTRIIVNGKTGILSVLGDGGYPYTVPVNYAYSDGKIYIHGAKQGHKLDAIRRYAKVSMCVIEQDDVIAERLTTHFRSAILFGKARILTRDEEIFHAAEALGMKYYPNKEAVHKEIKREWAGLSCVEITIDHMSGKEAIELVRERTK